MPGTQTTITPAVSINRNAMSTSQTSEAGRDRTGCNKLTESMWQNT